MNNNQITTLGHPGLTGIIYADYDLDDLGEPYLAMQIVGGDTEGTDFATFDGPFADWMAERIWGWKAVQWARDGRHLLMAGNAA
jgi:hypothetical protein